MTVISDSCYSGTGSRELDRMKLLPPEHREYSFPRYLDPKFLPDDTKSASLPDALETRPNGRIAYPESGMNHLFLSGCLDSEVSWDVEIDGTYHGAMSYHAVKAIREAAGNLSYAELAGQLQPMLDAGNYAQHPQLEGPDERKQRSIFT
jgi:metacaspase-1